MMNNSDCELYFRISGVAINFRLTHPILINDAFIPFITEKPEETEEQLEVLFCRKDNLDFETGQTVFENQIFTVKKGKGKYIRIYRDHSHGGRPYAVGEFLSGSKEKICYRQGSEEFFSEAYNCFAHIAFEEMLLRKNAVILHASFISTLYGGVLFSGPSGIGKSTQADLWVKYRSARMINGDRTILRKTGSEWLGYGSPYAGSSKCYRNEAETIKAIVFLQQAEQCSIKRLNPIEAFVRLYSGMTVNTWNRDYVEHISEIVRNIAAEVPMYLYSCTRGKESVSCLEYVLKEGGRIEE